MASEIYDEIFMLIKNLNNAKTYSDDESKIILTQLNTMCQNKEIHSEVCQHLNTLNFPGEWPHFNI